MKSKHQQQVEQFMLLAKQDVPPYPVLPDRKILRLRAKLILEECLETIAALGFLVQPDMSLNECGSANLVEIIDGCCDIAVVTTGTLSACGVPDEVFQVEINRNNLAKFGPGHSYREDGKLVKPPGHSPPDIAGLLATVRGAPQKPTIVCLCGSTRFQDAFIAASRSETLIGRIVLSVGMFGHSENLDMSGPTKLALDRLHLRKIDLADEVLVLNVGRHIGESTKNEINYALKTGKPIRYLE